MVCRHHAARSIAIAPARSGSWPGDAQVRSIVRWLRHEDGDRPAAGWNRTVYLERDPRARLGCVRQGNDGLARGVCRSAVGVGQGPGLSQPSRFASSGRPWFTSPSCCTFSGCPSRFASRMRSR